MRDNPLADIPAEVRAEYRGLRVLRDGRIIGVHRFLFTWGLIVDIDPVGYADRYCYHDLATCSLAFLTWDGTGEPNGWHRHPKSGRRRNIETGEEWMAH